ncbi:hypothetical protein LG275_03985 [Chryseomicrobium palamuruense]
MEVIYYEDFYIYSVTLLFRDGENFTKEHLDENLPQVLGGNNIIINLSIDDTLIQDLEFVDHESLNALLRFNKNIDSDSITKISYKIIKNVPNVLTIYNYNEFLSKLSGYTLEQLLSSLSGLKNGKNEIKLNFLEYPEAIIQSSLFSSMDLAPLILQNSNEDIRGFALLHSYNQLNENNSLVPSDLYIKDIPPDLDEFCLILNNAAKLFALSFLVEQTLTDSTCIRFKLTGYKSIELQIDLKIVDIELPEELFVAYEWIYKSDINSMMDKLGLIRNILPRYLINSSENRITLETGLLESIYSSHKIYLKDSVEKYIEVKNKLTEIVTEQSLKASNTVQFLESNFKNNNLTLMTFFISLFIFSALSEGVEKIFTMEIFLISSCLLAISLIYLLVTFQQYKVETSRFTEYFYSIKDIYVDLFDQNELNSIFSKDKLEVDLKYIKNTGRKYFRFWLLEIILLSFLSVYMTFIHDSDFPWLTFTMYLISR